MASNSTEAFHGRTLGEAFRVGLTEKVRQVRTDSRPCEPRAVKTKVAVVCEETVRRLSQELETRQHP